MAKPQKRPKKVSLAALQEALLENEIVVAPTVENTVFSLAFGQAVYQIQGVIDGEGNVKESSTSIEFSHNARTFIDPRVKVIRGLTVNREYATLQQINAERAYPVGSGLIAGAADTGKSPFLVLCLNVLTAKSHLLRFGEPLPGYLTDELDAVKEFAEAIFDPDIKVVGIDSLKDVLAVMKGNSMARGIPRGFWRMISEWGSVIGSLQKAVIVPLNISTDDEKAIAEVNEAVKSNVTSAFVFDPTSDRSNQEYLYKSLFRTGEGKTRISQDWLMKFVDGKPELSVAGNNVSHSSQVNVVSPVSYAKVVVSQSSINAAMSRNIKGVTL